MYSRNLLFSLYRGSYEEISVQGEIVVFDGNETLFQSAEVTGIYPARSLLKPFQFLATGVVDANWNEAQRKQFTACVGSMSATKDQIEMLKTWYPDQKLLEKLLLPPSYPMDEKNRVALKEAGVAPSPLFHTCFSKHLGILMGCAKNKWPMEEYLSLHHPYHRMLMQTLSEIIERDLTEVECVTDGCLLPSPALSLKRQAKLYQRLAAAKDKDSLGVIKKLMLDNPEWVGGPKRIDTLLMQNNRGRVIAKEGADGLLGIGVLPNTKFPNGLGVIVKLAMGYQPNYSAIALGPLLAYLDLKPVHEPPKGHEVRYHYKPFAGLRQDLIDITPRVCPKTAVWPGDIEFRLERSKDTLKGDLYTLASIQTTLHIGAHTDAPNHYEKNERGIDTVVIEKYAGPVQVISLIKPPSSRITSKDIGSVPILAKRILFKTDSYPNPTEFTKDFVSLSSDVVKYLADRGVVLVGIDTPSIDLYDCKKLESHHETTKTGMAVLEGINLEGVESGVYELIALPLKLENADASPVRAVLRTI